MAITREQIKAANRRGSAAIARGPVARAARYDARRALIVISLEGGCEFSFPTALAEGLTDAPRSKLKKIDQSERTGIALAAHRESTGSARPAAVIGERLLWSTQNLHSKLQANTGRTCRQLTGAVSQSRIRPRL